MCTVALYYIIDQCFDVLCAGIKKKTIQHKISDFQVVVVVSEMLFSVVVW